MPSRVDFSSEPTSLPSLVRLVFSVPLLSAVKVPSLYAALLLTDDEPCLSSVARVLSRLNEPLPSSRPMLVFRPDDVFLVPSCVACDSPQLAFAPLVLPPTPKWLESS